MNRAESGKTELLNGERALQAGLTEEAREKFAAALHYFRGPDLRLGEAHALRGLAQVALSSGEPANAERWIREAIDGYQAIHELLEQAELAAGSLELVHDAREGEAAALVVLGEVHVRKGQLNDARQALAHAREVYSALGPTPSSAAAWTATARLALLEGHTSRARESLEKALAIYESSANLAGQVGVWLQFAELERVERNVKRNEDALNRALAIAQGARHATLETRVLAALGSLHLQQMKLHEAMRSYEQALPLARQSGDAEVEGFILLGLGDAGSRLYEEGSFQSLLDGTRILASIDHKHGVATGLLRIGEHALRVSQADLALAAAEGARRLYRNTDPVRGAGFALRVIVKAFALKQDPYAVLVAAIAREAVAGAVQQNARDVSTFYRKRAPAEVLDALRPIGAKGIVELTEQLVLAGLADTLKSLSFPATVLDHSNGALALIEAHSARIDVEPQLGDGETATTTAEPGILEDIPPEDEVSMVIMVKGPAATIKVPGPTIEARSTVQPTTRVARPNPGPAIPSLSAIGAEDFPTEVFDDHAPAPVTGYEAFYDSPETVPAAAAEAEPEAPDEPEVPVPDALKLAPPPADYAGFYDSPEDEA